MARFLTASALLIFITTFSSFGQGIQFFEGSFEEAKEQAKLENKLIFVDAYTTWCGPCKRLSKNVFPKAEVGSYYNSNFICVKLDMDKKENFDFAKNYMVTAYPTLLYIDGDGKMVHKALGGRDVTGFIKEGQKAYLSNPQILEKYQQQYSEGDRAPEFLRDYITTLYRVGTPDEVILSEYLSGQTEAELVSDQNTNLIFLTANNINSPSTELLMADKDLYVAKYGQDKVDFKLNSIVDNTVSKAAAEKDKALFNAALEFLKKSKVEGYKAKSSSSSLMFYQETGNFAEYSKTVSKHFKKYPGDNDQVLYRVAANFLLSSEDESYYDQCLSFAESAVALKDNFNNNLVLAKVYYAQGQLAEARVFAEYAITRANEEKKFAGEAMNLIDQIKKVQMSEQM